MLEQLADLTGTQLPTVFVSEANREVYCLELIVSAAQLCAADGQRLLLVVDGSDENRGVTTGPQAHSIAGLSARRPSAGMRVIVAGRPNPPIPDDVPDWPTVHALRRHITLKKQGHPPLEVTGVARNLRL